MSVSVLMPIIRNSCLYSALKNIGLNISGTDDHKPMVLLWEMKQIRYAFGLWRYFNAQHLLKMV